MFLCVRACRFGRCFVCSSTVFWRTYRSSLLYLFESVFDFAVELLRPHSPLGKVHQACLGSHNNFSSNCSLTCPCGYLAKANICKLRTALLSPLLHVPLYMKHGNNEDTSEIRTLKGAISLSGHTSWVWLYQQWMMVWLYQEYIARVQSLVCIIAMVRIIHAPQEETIVAARCSGNNARKYESWE